MAKRKTILLHPVIDARDLGPQHIDILLPSSIEHAPGNGLAPSYSAHALVPLATSDGIVVSRYTHPVYARAPASVAPGVVEVDSTWRSPICLFCLGGMLSTACENGHSICSLESPAPILLIGKSLYDNDLDPIDVFVSELGSWLSLMRARARGDVRSFERLLLRVPAFTLYMQGLILAARRLGEVSVDERNERYWCSLQTINGALKAARERPHVHSELPNLEMLLDVGRGR